MPENCGICEKLISDERLENGFDDPNEYPRNVHHDLRDGSGGHELLHSADYLVCSRRCHDMTFMQFKGEIALKVFKTDDKKVSMKMPNMRKGMMT